VFWKQRNEGDIQIWGHLRERRGRVKKKRAAMQVKNKIGKGTFNKKDRFTKWT